MKQSTLEKIFKDALSEYDLGPYLDDFLTNDISWTSEKLEPVIKESLERIIKVHGKRILKDMIDHILQTEISLEDIIREVLEDKIQNLSIEELLQLMKGNKDE